MADRISREQRSRNMSRIRSRDTVPEMRVRSLLHRSGFRFRLHQRDLPGKPDIVLKKHKAVIFIHGCFWHRHKNCSRATIPKTRTGYWLPKLLGNVRRDASHTKLLDKKKWRVLVVWECETKDEPKLLCKLLGFLKK